MITKFKLWLLKLAVSYALKTLNTIPGKVINYFETLKENKKKLEEYHAEQLTEEARRESDINLLK